MQMLYDSDEFVVVQMEVPRDGTTTLGFEIVDKANNAEVFLVDKMAAAFIAMIESWKRVVPSQREVDLTLAEFTTLGQLPLVMH